MKRILRATAAMGLSSLLTVALGAVRYKFIAVELGAPGVGLLGILTSAATLGVVIFCLGLNTSGVQATASAGEASSGLGHSGRRWTPVWKWSTAADSHR